MAGSYKISLKTNGEIHFGDVVGFGPRCKQALKGIQEILGMADESTRRFTEEYNDESDQDLHQQL